MKAAHIIKPVASYFIFVSDRRESLSIAHPDMSFSEMLKAASQEWRNMSEEQRAPYVALHMKDEERYQS